MMCNRCGSIAPDGAMSCQKCGAPLSGKVDNGLNQRMGGAQEQPGLPAWLESLRVGERPVAPVSNPLNFSATDLIDEGDLPNWMRPERSAPNEASGPISGIGSRSSFSDPMADEGKIPPQGLAAQSLIDKQSLPSWMQESQPPTGATPQSALGGIAASSLVQPDQVPDWMKTLQQQHASPGPAATPSTPPIDPIAPPRQGFSPRDLIDEQSLPSWMSQQQGSQGLVPPTNTKQPEQTHVKPSMKPADPTSPPRQGFSPRDLIDEQSLPSWMSQQQSNQGLVPPANAKQPEQVNVKPPELANGFSASSLLDVNSLPPWLRESGQEQKSSLVPPAQPAAPMQANTVSWQTPAQPVPTSFANGEGISAASFIDKNALPQWLRSTDEQAGRPVAQQPQQQGQTWNQKPEAYNVPPRVENMRVPNRPRSEMSPSESSEVAANVFSSMLGVASATPQFPMPSGNQPYFSPNSMQQGMSPTSGMLEQGSQRPTGMPPQGYGDGSQGNYQMGASSAGMPQYPTGMPQYPAGASQYPTSMAGISQTPPMPRVPGMIGEQKANKPKRSLVEALRDWLFR